MGTVKDEMKPSVPAAGNPADDKGGGVFDKLRRKSPKPASVDESKLKFAEMLERADARLGELLTTKEAELRTEKGQEDYNRRALALLRTMGYHLDEVINTAVDYSNLK